MGSQRSYFEYMFLGVPIIIILCVNITVPETICCLIDSHPQLSSNPCTTDPHVTKYRTPETSSNFVPAASMRLEGRVLVGEKTCGVQVTWVRTPDRQVDNLSSVMAVHRQRLKHVGWLKFLSLIAQPRR